MGWGGRWCACVVVLGVLVTASAVLAATSSTIRGNGKANTLRGTAAADSIYGLAGNDKLYGAGGNDRLYGGPGNDLLVGGPGADTFACGAGVDTVVGDTRDTAARDCEHVRGIAKPVPKPACSNGSDDDYDDETDYPDDPGCASASDDDETDDQNALPGAKQAQPGQYCGFTEQGPGLCLTTASDGLTLATFQTSAIVDCTNGDRWTWSVTFSGRSIVLQGDLSFVYEYSGPLTNSSSAVTNVQETEFVRGTFTEDGKASGTLAISHLSWDEGGTHYECSQNPVSWHAARQG